MTEMAILQEVDKCMRCNGCVIACKRTWNIKADSVGVHKVGADQRLAIKSQKRVDMGPFVRFSCWHCPSPPCAAACPLGAMVKRENGAVDIDRAKCDPDSCKTSTGQYPCQLACQRGGYPKIGNGYLDTPDPKSMKCTLCYGKAGADDPTKPMLPTRSTDLKSKLTLPSGGTLPHPGVIPELAHEPACVMSCPAKAMVWDTKANIIAYLSDKGNGYYIGTYESRNWLGNGSMFWASKKTPLAPPKADPLVEDHLTPMVSSLTSGPLAKAALVPTLVVGGLLAVSARRAANEKAATAGEEV